MQTLRELYKIGRGPSSSHTMGPERAVKYLKDRYPQADLFRVTLLGSLAATGKGHQTDLIVRETFAPVACEVAYDFHSPCSVHPNTMDVEVFQNGAFVAKTRLYSVGGGAVIEDGKPEPIGQVSTEEVYPLNTFAAIEEACEARAIRLSDYVFEREGEEIKTYLADIWQTMKNCIHEGLTKDGVLPGGIGTERRAKALYNQRHIDESAQTRENRIVCSYAFSVGEQNASGGTIVTAPTCGACGVLPSVLLYMQQERKFSDEQIVRALAVGGLVGNIVKSNASISGAECGCQAEIGTACSMAAAALAELFGMGLRQIEYAAEVAMEHHLGLTCDPIGGLVQIPCIERNAVAAMRAINALSLANFLSSSRKIRFDVVVAAMYNTGKDLHKSYRETSAGGLAKYYPLDSMRK